MRFKHVLLLLLLAPIVLTEPAVAKNHNIGIQNSIIASFCREKKIGNIKLIKCNTPRPLDSIREKEVNVRLNNKTNNEVVLKLQNKDLTIQANSSIEVVSKFRIICSLCRKFTPRYYFWNIFVTTPYRKSYSFRVRGEKYTELFNINIHHKKGYYFLNFKAK